MLSLSPTDLARVKALTDRCYPLFSPLLRTIFNEQLLESRDYGEYLDWLERAELTYLYYEQPLSRHQSGRARKRKA